MIAVIADDLAGAAELAAAATDLGLAAEVHTSFRPRSDADVVAVDTDTRSLNPTDAARVVGDVARDVLRAGPSWLYKKTDSVLRGNVRAEILALLAATGMTRATLVPANPSKGRVIVGGVYYVGGVPLDQTPFSRDPEHPRKSSRVADLLGGPADGTVIDVPDIPCADEVVRRAVTLTDNTLPAGGVEFFQSILRARIASAGRAAPHPSALCDLALGGRQLFMCGSAQAWTAGRRGRCDQGGVPVVTMPDALFASPELPRRPELEGWADAIAAALATRGHAMAAIGRDADPDTEHAAALANALVAGVVQALDQTPVERVCLEGGATAAAFLQAMGWVRLVAVPCRLPGVAALRPHGATAPSLLIKPGSYPWPDDVWPDVSQSAAPPCG